MSSNKRAKEKLIELYGPECFIEKLSLRKDKDRRYTSKGQMEKMRQLTYHHILERSKGGKATVENGALLTAENHSWFHKQSKGKQAWMNKRFQEYKGCKVEFVDDFVSDIEVKYTIMEFEERPKEKYSRSKAKKETKRLIEEEEYER